jgi:hypothetical protein
MKLFKKLAVAAAVSLAMVGSASADVIMNNWKFNPLGTGVATAQTINEYLDVNGNSFIQLTATSASTFNFVEHAVFNIGQADSNGAFFPLTYPGGNITATFEAYGSGNFSGAFAFAGGVIKMYQNPVNGQYATSAGFYGANVGTQIAEFSVMAGGGGQVDGTGNPLTNGNISVFAKATSPGGMAPGYFFRGNGVDLSNEDIMSFAFTNANAVGLPTGMLVNEVACQYASYAGPGCGSGIYTNVPGSHFFVSNNGQFKLAEVPEPGSLALFGLAMLGAGVISRKRKQA